MAQAIDPAHLELILKTMGIENVKEVTKAFEDMKDATKDVIAPLDAAKKVLDETKDSSKLTAEELNKLAGQAKKVEETTLDAEASLKKMTKALDDLEREEEKELIAAIKVAEAHEKMMEATSAATGSGEGESGTGGFAGAAAGVMKLERAFTGLATGHGIRGATTALEGLTGMLGGPAGIGIAIGAVVQAIDITIPKFEKFMEKLDGTAKSVEMIANRLKDAADQMMKLKAQPTEEEEAGVAAVKPLLAGRRGMQIAQGIEDVLRSQGYGISPEQAQLLAAPGVSQREKDVILRQQEESIKIQRARKMEGVLAGRPGAIGELVGMAGQFPGMFPGGTEQQFIQAMPENIEAARKQALQAEVDSAWAEQTYKQREAARRETIDIQEEFNKARRDKRIQESAERERDDAVTEAARLADERRATQARRQEEHNRLKHERQVAKELTPLAQMERNIRGFAPGLEAEGFNVRQVASEALRQLPATGGNAASAIQQAIFAAYERGLRMQQQDMQRMQVFTEMFQGSR